MPRLVVLFHDGELMYAESPELRFDLPVIEAEVVDVDSNSERAIIPLTAIRQMIVGEPLAAPGPDELQGWDRAAFHFTDGQVLRALVGPESLLGAHGGVWHTVEQGQGEVRVLAIPYTSLKAVFRLRQWDGRRTAERSLEAVGTGYPLAQTVRVLAEREVRAAGGAPRPAGQRLLERLRGADRGAPPPEA